ncbi:MAG TPA: universal stress protein [Dehalococcoidia bacterium]|nr:universal stress protein [Dehalococcoidia bacterium]
MPDQPDAPRSPRSDDVRTNLERQRRASEARRRRARPVGSGELNPGGGEYLVELPRGPGGTGSAIGDGKDDSMTTIMVPVDGSETAAAAVPVARWLASGLHAEVVLLCVGPDPETRGQARDEDQALERVLAAASAKLTGILVRRRIQLANDPAAGILEAARAEHPDLIVMSTHGRTGWAGFTRRSVAAEVVRAGIAPVTLILPAARAST